MVFKKEEFMGLEKTLFDITGHQGKIKISPIKGGFEARMPGELYYQGRIEGNEIISLPDFGDYELLPEIKEEPFDLYPKTLKIQIKRIKQ